MNLLFSKTKLLAIVTTAVIALLATLPAAARDNPADHPIKVLKARYQNDHSRGNSMSARGTMTVWMQNAADLPVDGIVIEVDLYNNRRRKVETLKREVEMLEPGQKRVITFSWDVLAEREVKPRFFIEYYSRGKQKTRFEGDSPNWH